MAGHAQLKFVMTECSKTQIRLKGLISSFLQLLEASSSQNILKASVTFSYNVICLVIRNTKGDNGPNIGHLTLEAYGLGLSEVQLDISMGKCGWMVPIKKTVWYPSV